MSNIRASLNAVLRGARLGILGAVLGLTALVALPATPAAASMSQCASGFFCVWNATGFTDGPGSFGGNNQNWSLFSHSTCPSGTWNNCASSAYNHGSSGLGVNIYVDIDYATGSFCFPQGTSETNLSVYTYTNGANVNNSISSNFWTSTCHS